MRALEEADKVGRRNDERPITSMHYPESGTLALAPEGPQSLCHSKAATTSGGTYRRVRIGTRDPFAPLQAGGNGAIDQNDIKIVGLAYLAYAEIFVDFVRIESKPLAHARQVGILRLERQLHHHFGHLFRVLPRQDTPNRQLLRMFQGFGPMSASSRLSRADPSTMPQPTLKSWAAAGACRAVSRISCRKSAGLTRSAA